MKAKIKQRIEILGILFFINFLLFVFLLLQGFMKGFTPDLTKALITSSLVVPLMYLIFSILKYQYDNE